MFIIEFSKLIIYHYYVCFFVCFLKYIFQSLKKCSYIIGISMYVCMYVWSRDYHFFFHFSSLQFSFIYLITFFLGLILSYIFSQRMPLCSPMCTHKPFSQYSLIIHLLLISFRLSLSGTDKKKKRKIKKQDYSWIFCNCILIINKQFHTAARPWVLAMWNMDQSFSKISKR